MNAAAKVLLFALAVAPVAAPAQDVSDAKPRELITQMVAALGDDAWANRQTYLLEGNSAGFFKSQPQANTPFRLYHKGAPGTPGLTRVEIGKKRDVIQLWNDTTGYELTYKGKRELPRQIRDEYFRAQHHTLGVAMLWFKDSQTILTYGGMSMVGRWQTDSITLVSKDNDNITLDLDVNTHLPMRVSYKTRNAVYKDFDEDQEEYSDYHLYGGVQTPVTITRYHNGDMVTQRFFTAARYNLPLDDGLFDPDQPYNLKHK